MQHETGITADIAIAGGGIAGLALALALKDTPCSVVLVDRHAQPERAGPSGILSPGALALLQELGLEETPTGEEWPGEPITRCEVRHPDRGELFAISLEAPGGMPGPARGVDRSELLALLRRRLATAQNVRIISGAEATGLLRTATRCTGLRADYDGRTLDVRARLTVLADGAASRLRARAGLDLVPRGRRHRWLLFTIPRPQELGQLYLAYISAFGLVNLLPLPGCRARVAFRTHRGELRSWRELDELGWRRQAALRAPMLVHTPLRLTDGRVHIVEPGEAPTYHRPGLCLLGDAARVVDPTLGHGMELALFDAVVLGRLLAGLDLDNEGALHDALSHYERISRHVSHRVRASTRRFLNLAADSRISRFLLFVVLPRWNRLAGFDARAARLLALTPPPLPRSLGGRWAAGEEDRHSPV